jgi:hypothetical protein
MPPNQKLHLSVIVNGEPTLVEVNANAPLRTVIPPALHQSGNAGQPPENWELRDAAGALLDLDAKIGSFGFPADAKVFLNLKAGIGG